MHRNQSKVSHTFAACLIPPQNGFHLMIPQDGTTSNLQGEKSRMVEPKISVISVCCFSDVFDWHLELETSILNGCLVKQPFLKSRFSKNHPTEASIDINGCLRFQVVILGRQPKNMTLSFRLKKLTGCRPGSTKVPCHLISGLSRKLFFRSKKKSEMVSQLEFITQFS